MLRNTIRTSLFIRLFSIALFSVLWVVPLAAGGSVESSENTNGSKSSGDVYVLIQHKYGLTKLPALPQRVVSVGFSEHDTLLALGVTPVAVRDWYGDMPFATWPWAEDALDGAEPVVLPAGELDFEQIASLKPDVIVGISSGMTEDEYATLSQIAPTIAQPGDYVDYGTPWQEETRILGEVLGKSREAQSIISQIENRLAQASENHPEFQGASAAVAFVYQNLPGAYASQDSRSRLVQQLGFVIPEEYDEIAGNSFYVSFSEERLDLLDTDVILWIASSEEAIDDIKNLPLRKSLKASAEGREVFMGKILSGAFSFASPLSINYLLDVLIPGLAAAVDGDPSTLVPEAIR